MDYKGIKVNYIITDLDYGGAETQLIRLAILLKKRGWEVRVICLMPPKAYTKELIKEGISVISLGIERKICDPGSIFRLAKLIRTWQPHIVHSFMVHANLVARLVRPLVSVPVLICSARSINEGGRLREIFYRLTDPLCEVTTQVSIAGMERYIRIKAVRRDKIRMIPNGVDITKFRPDFETRNLMRNQMGLDNYFVWLAVGRLDVQKDYPNMINAFDYITKTRPKTLLLIVGDGPLRLTLENQVARLGQKERILFLGKRLDVAELMNAADGYVLSSVWEGMANVLLEASATALPIVATDVGGNREVVINGKSGILVPSKNPKALAEAMCRIMDLPLEERQKMGNYGRKNIDENYSLESIGNQWEEMYRELILK